MNSPCCGDDLENNGDAYACASCGHHFPITNGIPQLFWPHEGMTKPYDVTEVVKAFYEETPFPNYDDHESVRSLIEKSRQGKYARRLNESIPYNSTILEVGCGTGQLSNFLGVSCHRVIATDMCLNSLRLGEVFRKENGLERVRFVQMNLFQPALKRANFDVVICNGVLHHTANPRDGFTQLASLVKPGGYIVIGLYNVYGRLMTDLRRMMLRLFGKSVWRIDPVLRHARRSGDRHEAWLSDQYLHPHESKHTFDEILDWLDQSGFDFVRGIPAMRPEDDGLSGTSLFEPQRRVSRIEHLLVQFAEIFGSGQREGGFFIIIGRKHPDAISRESFVDDTNVEMVPDTVRSAISVRP